jgi:hypothetical protein
MFLIFGHCVVVPRLILRLRRAAIIADRRVLTRPVLVVLRGVFLLVGTVFVASGVIAAGADDDLGHAGRGGQK